MSNWIASAMIVFIAGAALVALNSTGNTSRQYEKSYHMGDPRLPVMVEDNSREVYAFIKEKGMHGRILIHLSKYLHFVPPDVSSVYEGIERFPIITKSLSREYEKMVDQRNFLWIAMRTNIARRIYHVLPPYMFTEKREAVEAYTRGVSVKQGTIITHFLGSSRVIAERMPTIKEPVLLIIDASYFEYAGGSSLFDDLRASGVKTDLLILCLSEDNPDVQEQERKKLRQFAELLRKQGDKDDR